MISWSRASNESDCGRFQVRRNSAGLWHLVGGCSHPFCRVEDAKAYAEQLVLIEAGETPAGQPAAALEGRLVRYAGADWKLALSEGGDPPAPVARLVREMGPASRRRVQTVTMPEDFIFQEA